MGNCIIHVLSYVVVGDDVAGCWCTWCGLGYLVVVVVNGGWRLYRWSHVCCACVSVPGDMSRSRWGFFLLFTTCALSRISSFFLPGSWVSYLLFRLVGDFM